MSKPKRGPIDHIKEKRSRLETNVEFTLCHTLPSVRIQYKVYIDTVDSQAFCLHVENVLNNCFGFIEFMYVTGKYGEYNDVKTH